jgi:endonuclease/exonuclease/phosphatase family metal-dependent hydrolase
VQVDDQATTTTALSRPSLQITVTTATGREVQLISCRFKFKLLGFPHGFTPDDEDQRARYATYALDRRAAEAATVRIRANELLDGHGQDRPVIVLGDLNDTEYSATTTLLQGPGGSEIGTGGFSHPDQGDAYRLWNHGLAIPVERRFSRIYQGRHELIDHIFVSHALLDGLGQVATHDIGAPSIGDDPTANPAHPASDHRPVTADLAD